MSAKKVISFAARYVLPTGVSVGLIVWFLNKVDLHKVITIINEGVNIWFLLAMMLFTTLSEATRGIRWGIQLRGVGIPRMPATAEACSIFGAYALNLLFPRLGEAWRCIYVSRRQNCPFMTVVGTDIGDRTSDLICLIIFIIIGMFISRPELMHFMDHYAVGRAIKDVLWDKWLWIGLAALCLVYCALIKWCIQWRWVQSLKKGLTNVWHGFAILFHMKQLDLYLWLTLLLWVSYFCETYICFYAFDFTREILVTPDMAWGLRPGMMCMIFGICSTIVPSNGGLGPWTIATTYALVLFGLTQDQAAAYALVVWGFQTVAVIVLGIFAAIYISHHKSLTGKTN